MKNILLVLAITLFFTQTVKGQRIFIGENSYPSTDTFTLLSNSDDRHDLQVSFAKQGTLGLIAVSIKTLTKVLISGKLTIYLEDGKVIICNNARLSDYVDGVTTTVYYFKIKDLDKLKNSNISKIRYALKCGECNSSSEEGDFSASNLVVDFPVLINDLFE